MGRRGWAQRIYNRGLGLAIAFLVGVLLGLGLSVAVAQPDVMQADRWHIW